MLADADVLKIKSHFVEEMIKFIKLRKYVINPCLCKVTKAYSDYLLATLLSECLTYKIECALKEKSKQYTIQVDPGPTSTPCDTQVDLQLSLVNTATCTYAISLENSLNKSSYPEAFTTDDSQYLNVKINVVSKSSCDGSIYDSTETIGGCINGNCSNSYLGTVPFTYYVQGSTKPLATTSTCYIKTLRVYKCDSNGNLDTTPIELDLDYNTSPYFSAGVNCPGCVTLTGADVMFGNPNFSTNFNTLMDNVSKALFGVGGKHLMSASVSGTPKNLSVTTIAKHSPAGNWFGINRLAPAYIIIKDNNTSATYTGFTATGLGTPTVKIQNSVSVNTPCGTLTGVVKVNGGASLQPVIDWNDTSFNKIKIAQPFTNIPLVYSGQNNQSCSSYILQATYPTPPVSITSKGWYNVSNVLLTSNNEVTVSTPGDYTFKIMLSNGCLTTKTITV